MIHFFREVRELRNEGKLHRRLIVRTRILAAISAMLLAIVLYNIIFRGADWLFASVLAFVGLLLGIFLFSRMSPVQWNEEQEVVETGRMDTLGYVILVLYIGLEIGTRTILHDLFPISATALLLAGVFGVLAGRVIGSVVEIHRVYLTSHNAI
jgi:hypothetical protein